MSAKFLSKNQSKHANSFIKDCIELTKFRLLLMVLLVTSVAYLLSSPLHFSYEKLTILLVGTLFLGAAAHILNQYLEVDVDRLMQRTKNRPLPRKRISKEKAKYVGYALSIIGTALLYIYFNEWTAFFGVLTFVSYVFIYTPLKKISILNTWVGAIPGALPVLLGWSAAEKSLNDKLIYLFLVLLIWQIPHFLAISWKYKKDYIKGGLKMLSMKDSKGNKTSINMFLHTLLLVLLPIIFWKSDGFSVLFLTSNVVVALFFLIPTMIFFSERTIKKAVFVFAISIFYLPLQLITFLF